MSIKRGAAALLAGAMLSVAERAVAETTPPLDVHSLLDVPFVAQTPELCGGAAVAMVLRYWGERNVFPQDFGPLVGSGDGGILTGVLASAVRDRGWQALVTPLASDLARAHIRSEIDRGRPPIALIEVAPGTYHYVVIVGSTDQEVVLHDPARAPFRVLPWAEFERAWATTGRWMMVVLPPSGFRRGDAVAPAMPASSDVAPASQTPCGALVQHAVHLARNGDSDEAERGLVAATSICPNDPASWRELAGWRFSQSRWSEARDLALSAVALAPDDLYAWQLVATSRYLAGEAVGALEAWNRMGEPRVDAIVIHGADRTRQPVVVRATGLQPRQVLSPEGFGRARRRLRDLPVAAEARLRYEPIDGGLAKVDIVLEERHVVPSGWIDLATLGARALLLDELRVDVAGPLGVGELESAAWRWSAGRPRVVVGLAVPSPQWFPGVVSIEGMWERQSYDTTIGAALALRESRRRVGLHVADWSTRWLRWQTGAALDRAREYDVLDDVRTDARDYLAMESTLDVRLAGDRFAAGVSAGWWVPVAGGNYFGTGALLGAWRSTDEATRPVWSAVSEIGLASRVAPLALWHGAGTGTGRAGLLRAHPLLTDGVVTGPVFGRNVARGSVEYARPMVRTPRGGVSMAGFVDAARAWHRLNGLGTSALYLDAGIGVRAHATGAGGAVRIDVAHGLRGGGTTLSAGWGAQWPR
jgi:predicted double-glycine peptidase